MWCWHSARFCRFIVNVSKKACVFIAVWYNMPIHEAVETHSLWDLRVEMILIPVHMRGAYRFYDDVSFFYALRMGSTGQERISQ